MSSEGYVGIPRWRGKPPVDPPRGRARSCFSFRPGTIHSAKKTSASQGGNGARRLGHVTSFFSGGGAKKGKAGLIKGRQVSARSFLVAGVSQ